MEYFLAIDIGASSGRHILGHIDAGKLVIEELHRFQNGAEQKDGHLVWNTEKLFNEILEGIKKCKAENKIPKSIAIDTWGVDYVLLNKSNQIIEPVYCYRDERTKNFIDTSVTFKELYYKTGIQFQPFNTVYQLLADKADGRLNDATDFLMLPEYFSYLLTGIKAKEYTNATTTGLIDATTRNWDYEIIEKLGFSKNLFKDLVSPGHKLSCFSSDIQNIVGFNSTVILVASHDTASAVVALPKDNSLYISSGTWSLLGVERLPVLTDKAREANYTNEGALNGKVRFQKNIMGLWIIQQIRHELCDKFSFAELVEMAEKEATYAWKIDVNSKSLLSPKSMIEAVKNQCKMENQPVPNTVGELAHCVYSSLAYSYKVAIDELENITNLSYETLCIVGGGSNNNYLNKLTAEATGKLVLSGPSEATAAGNLLVQLISSNEFAAINSLRRLINDSFEIKEIK